MNNAELAVALKPAVAALPSNFMLDGATYAKGAELGFEGMDFYVAGRGGALGDVPADVVAATFVYFEPGGIRDAWDRSGHVMSRAQAAAEFAGCAHAWARAHLAEGPDYRRAAELLGRVVQGASPSGAPLFAAWRSLDEPADDTALVLHHLNALRELRGGLHGGAILAAGFHPLEAVMISSPFMAGIFGWPEPHPDAGVLQIAWDGAEEATNVAFGRALEVLSEGEQTELLALGEAIVAAQS
ncbi:MAG: SCO6745 family protein [Actinomycetota bacterium]